MDLKTKLTSFVEKYDALLIFLILEALALLSFGLADANIIFRYLGFVIALALIPFGVLFVKKKEALSLLIFVTPLIIIALLTAFSRFSISTLNYGLLDNFSVLLGTLAFVSLGFLSRKIKKFKIEHALLTIGAAIALAVLISLLYSLYRYGPFHSAIYKNLVYYYDGRLYVVSKETKWLLGFEMTETLINYVNFYGALLVTALPGLLFISPRKELKKFLLTLGIGVVGLLSIVLVPNVMALLMLIPVLLFALYQKFVKEEIRTQKLINILFIAGFAVVGILLIIVFLNNLEISFIQNLLQNNHFLDRLFNTNRIMRPINDVLKAGFSSQGLFGFPLTLVDGLMAKTGAFEFEIMKEGGLFAFLALLVFLVFIIISTTRYLRKSKDDQFIKVIVVSALLVVFVYGSFLWTSFPLVYDSGVYVSFYRSNIYLIALFLIGYSFYPMWDLKCHEEIKKEDNEFVNKEIEL